MNEHYRFHPRAAFKRIDRLGTGKLNAYDISSFLRENKHSIYSQELSEVINSYDEDTDGQLDVTELSNILLSASDSVIRRRAMERYEEYVGPHDRLSIDVEYQICKILMLEIHGLKML